MRKFTFISVAMLLMTLLLCSSDIAISPEYNSYTPYFMMRSDLEKSVEYKSGAHEMYNPGKIYVRGDQIFVNERYKGVHIIDNSNPSNPVSTGFITAPGCLDMAVKGDIIYLDNSVDLVAFDMVSNTVTSRIKNCLDEPAAPNGDRNYGGGPSGSVLVGWKGRTSKYYN